MASSLVYIRECATSPRSSRRRMINLAIAFPVMRIISFTAVTFFEAVVAPPIKRG
jgi:hypothetical protein